MRIQREPLKLPITVSATTIAPCCADRAQILFPGAAARGEARLFAARDGAD
jgi:hypothetical protein